MAQVRILGLISNTVHVLQNPGAPLQYITITKKKKSITPYHKLFYTSLVVCNITPLLWKYKSPNYDTKTYVSISVL